MDVCGSGVESASFNNAGELSLWSGMQQALGGGPRRPEARDGDQWTGNQLWPLPPSTLALSGRPRGLLLVNTSAGRSDKPRVREPLAVPPSKRHLSTDGPPRARSKDARKQEQKRLLKARHERSEKAENEQVIHRWSVLKM